MFYIVLKSFSFERKKKKVEVSRQEMIQKISRTTTSKDVQEKQMTIVAIYYFPTWKLAFEQ